MTQHRNALPQLGDSLFLTDGGLETCLIYHDGLDLPEFAAFVLLKDAEGRAALERYYRAYADLAMRHGAGLVLGTPTWRANFHWGDRLGYAWDELAAANRKAVELVVRIRDDYASSGMRIVISGIVGPRGDGYIADNAMTTRESESYHRDQIDVFAEGEVDMVSAITMNTVEEAEGITRAAREAEMPVAISFTVETDGKLPTGQPLGEAIEQIDSETRAYPSYYMINCAHPTHFASALAVEGDWLARIGGIRANASRMSHAELEEATELDIGDPEELGREYAALKQRLPGLTVLGGCCGTDLRHIEQIAGACAPLFA